MRNGNTRRSILIRPNRQLRRFAAPDGRKTFNFRWRRMISARSRGGEALSGFVQRGGKTVEHPVDLRVRDNHSSTRLLLRLRRIRCGWRRGETRLPCVPGLRRRDSYLPISGPRCGRRKIFHSPFIEALHGAARLFNGDGAKLINEM